MFTVSRSRQEKGANNNKKMFHHFLYKIKPEYLEEIFWSSHTMVLDKRRYCCWKKKFDVSKFKPWKEINLLYHAQMILNYNFDFVVHCILSLIITPSERYPYHQTW